VIFRPWSWANATMSGQIDEWNVHLLGGRDDVLEMSDHALAMLGVGVERVRVVAQARDREALGGDLTGELRSLRGRQVRHVDVRRACVASDRSVGARPARDLDALEAVDRGPVDDVHQRRLGEGRGQQPEPHRAMPVGTWRAAGAPAPGRSTSTQRPSRALRAIASPTSISSWPSAKVG
jgi:hypothetical protein